MDSLRDYMAVIQKMPLFDGIPEESIEKMLGCFGARMKRYDKDEIVIHAGGSIRGVGIVLEGMAQVVKEDAFAHRSIVATVEPGELFAEVMACAGVRKSPVSVIAVTDMAVAFIGFRRIISTCPHACGHHTTLVQNMLRLIAEKNLMLNRKIDYLLIRSLRGRLAAYLLDQSGRAGALQFDIPYDRSGLADYLNADRSALSRELSRMKAQGLIDYYKNSFKLLRAEKLAENLEA